MKCNDQAMNFIEIVHELRKRNKYLELRRDEVCEKVEIMSRPRPCNTEDIPPSNTVKAMIKEEVLKYRRKTR